MEAEKVLNFYDWFWFQRHIFEKEPTFSFWSNSEANPDGEKEEEEEVISMSGSLSPNSVLSTSKLRSLFSESTDLENSKTSCERKSLSNLEFEEVKGFKDLGFVFSEEDRNSSLASVIPGLNKLGLDESRISRPYLSEAWEVLALDRRRASEEINPLLKNWKLPSMSTQIDMKQNLRWWAHTVASTVR